MSNGRAGRTSNQLMVPLSGPPLQKSPPNRVCLECTTVLSIYNHTEACSLHAQPRKSKVNRVV
jgi:hypothetical protein